MHHHHQAQKSQERLKEEAETVRHCETLGLQMTSDSSITEVNKGELKAAFRRLALTLHPDKRENCPLAKEQFIRVKEAYDYLLPKCSGGGGESGGESGRTRERGRGGGPRDSPAQRQHKEKYSCFENSPKPKPPTSMPMPMPPPPPKPEKPKKEGEKEFSEPASRFKLYLGFSEFCKGITVMVPLKLKKQPQQQQENLLNFENNYYEAETKFFEVRVPAGASPGDTFFGYPIIFEKDNKSSSSSNVPADPAVQFELADLPGQQQFHRDPTLPGHLHTTVEVSAADWADLEADRRKYLLLKVPTIERGGGEGGGDDTKHITHLLMKSPASLKLEKEFRLPGRGLPVITTTGQSSLRGDLIVTIAVVPEVGQLKRKQQQQQLWYLEESPQQKQRQQLQQRHQELFEVFQSYQPKQQQEKKEKEEESKDSPSKLSDKLSDQLTKTKFSAKDFEKRTFFSDGGDSASSSSGQQTMSRLLGSFSTLFK